MSGRGSDAHPAKKKRKPKPRPDSVVPLTDTEREMRTRFEFGLALTHLAEAERLAGWGEAPHACVHSAYYAMYHCASAALLASGGVGPRRTSPASHVHVLEHFGRLTASDGGELAVAADALSRARLERMAADYGTGESVQLSDGRQMTVDAGRMIKACRARWRLEPPNDSSS